MGDSVKFIFKTILKVPIFIMISYFIANLFLFSLFYFKFLGVSYSVMQTALENNYIPSTEMSALQQSLNNIYIHNGVHSSVVPTASIYIDNNDRKQYGKTVEVGVKYQYRWIWPLMPEEYGQTAANTSQLLGADSGLADSSDAGNSRLDNGKSTYGEQELANRRAEKANKSTHEISITYKVPGLQYYSDLD